MLFNFITYTCDSKIILTKRGCNWPSYITVKLISLKIKNILFYILQCMVINLLSKMIKYSIHSKNGKHHWNFRINKCPSKRTQYKTSCKLYIYGHYLVLFYYSLCQMNHILIFLHHPIRIWFFSIVHSIVFWRHRASSPNWSLSIETIRMISWLANIESISSFISFYLNETNIFVISENV